MVECICIDNSNRPEVIRLNKWLKKGNAYNILFTTLVLPQRQIGVHLAEIELTQNELPYLIKDCNDTHFSINELLKQTELQKTD